jgi:hypothetical protein
MQCLAGESKNRIRVHHNSKLASRRCPYRAEAICDPGPAATGHARISTPNVSLSFLQVRMSRSMLNSYCRRHRTERTISVLIITAAIIISGTRSWETQTTRAGVREPQSATLYSSSPDASVAGDSKTNWRASAHHCPVDTCDNPIFAVIPLEITLHISNADSSEGLPRLRRETYRNDASPIRSVYWWIGYF